MNAVPLGIPSDLPVLCLRAPMSLACLFTCPHVPHASAFSWSQPLLYTGQGLSPVIALKHWQQKVVRVEIARAFQGQQRTILGRTWLCVMDSYSYRPCVLLLGNALFPLAGVSSFPDGVSWVSLGSSLSPALLSPSLSCPHPSGGSSILETQSYYPLIIGPESRLRFLF